MVRLPALGRCARFRAVVDASTAYPATRVVSLVALEALKSQLAPCRSCAPCNAAHIFTPCRCLRQSSIPRYFLRLPRCLWRLRPRFTSLGNPKTSRIRQAMSVSLLLCFTMFTSSSRVIGKVLTSSKADLQPRKEVRFVADSEGRKAVKQKRSCRPTMRQCCPLCEPVSGQ